MADLKTTQETTRSTIDGSELIRLATTGANWKISVNDVANYTRVGGSGISSVLTLKSTSIGSGATTDAVEIRVGNNGEFPAFYVGHIQRVYSSGQTSYLIVGDVTSISEIDSPAKLNVIGGGHYDVEGATLLLQTTDPMHCSVQFTQITDGIWGSTTPPEGTDSNFKSWNVGIAGTEGAASAYSGALMIHDHDSFLQRALFLVDGGVRLGNEAIDNPAMIVVPGAVPVVAFPGGAIALGEEDFGVAIAHAVGGALWTLTLPADAGSPGQSLKTDGSGNCYWG